LKRFYDKRTDFVPKLDTDVRSILETESDTHFKLFVTKGGSFQAQPAKGLLPSAWALETPRTAFPTYGCLQPCCIP
jgi:hypothetical protein